MRNRNIDEPKLSVNRAAAFGGTDLDQRVLLPLKVDTLIYLMALGVNLSFFYKSRIISLQVTLLHVLQRYKTKRSSSFAQSGK